MTDDYRIYDMEDGSYYDDDYDDDDSTDYDYDYEDWSKYDCPPLTMRNVVKNWLMRIRRTVRNVRYSNHSVDPLSVQIRTKSIYHVAKRFHQEVQGSNLRRSYGDVLMSGKPFGITGWYVEPEHGEDYTELIFVADFGGPAHYGITARIGLYDDEGREESIGRYWWRVVQQDESWIKQGSGDTFSECAAAVLKEATSMRDELVTTDD